MHRIKRGTAVSSGKMSGETIKRLLGYLKPYRAKLILVCICILISSAASVASSLFIQTLVDDYISPLLLQSNPVYSGLFKALCIMAVFYIFGVLSTLIYNRTMVTVSQSVLKQIRDQMFSQMQKLPIKYFDTHTHGDTMSLYTNDTDTLEQMLSQSIPSAFSSIITVVAVFFSMMSISIWLTAFVVVFMIIVLKTIGSIASKSKDAFSRSQKSLGDLNGYIEEMINGQKVVKVFCRESQSKSVFSDKNDILRKAVSEANGFSNILMPILNALGYILYVLIAILGGYLAISGTFNISLLGANVLTLGMIMSFLQLSRSFMQPVSQISQQIGIIFIAIAGAERIFKLLDEEPETDNGYVTLVNAKYDGDNLVETDERTEIWAWKHPHKDGTLTYTRVCGNVVFDDVDFGYEPNKIVLHNISLYAEPGQKIAFVGATGAGKTTITNLINRFYDIADGKIRYDGININKIKKADLRRSLGIVLQDVNLFTGTVMENIRYGRLDATDEECIAAAKLANADGFIKMLPNGYDTVLEGNGSGLSQGQRQLISIARVAVADPPVMILDEATSSIDTRTEAIVQRGMDALMYQRTVFVIAHRLSTIQNSNVIMLLDNGRIVERGNHDKLIAEKGKYYQLYTGAFELD